MLRGEVAEAEFLGSVVRVRTRVGDQSLSLDTFNTAAAPPPRAGETVEIGFASTDILLVGD